MESVTYVCILNWNGWQDTLGCVESLLNTQHRNYRVLVCDNGSTDSSVSHIENWAQGTCEAQRPDHEHLKSLYRKDQTPVDYQIVRATEILEGTAPAAEKPLVIILNEENIGFAAGNNRGIQYALMQPDMSHLWLLNNDTLVEPDCLDNMHKRLEACSAPAVVGSRVMFFDDPTIVQALGGNQFNPMTGTASESLGRFQRADDIPNSAEYRQSQEQAMDYVSGCSMLVPRQYLEEIGLMEESYFLYYEEIDWATRSRRLADKNKAPSFAKLIAFDAVLYHREGASIGSASLKQQASLKSEFFMFRSKLLFTRRHYPRYTLIVWAICLAQALNRLRQGRWQNFIQILTLIAQQIGCRLEDSLAQQP